MRFYGVDLHFWWRARVLAAIFLFLLVRSRGLNTDGVLLLSFKNCVLSDPLRVLESWHNTDETPCRWTGVTCGGAGAAADAYSRVTALSLPSSLLLGSIPGDLGTIEHLQKLDLSNNSLNGSLPASIFTARELRVLDLSNNLISGELPDSIGQLQSLQFLDLSDNALAGKLPNNLRNLRNLSTVSLKNNYISGSLPGGLQVVRVLDLSSNLINGSLPFDFGGDSLKYFNISYNRISGKIPPEFPEKIPGNAIIDLSFNDLAGEVPVSDVFANQRARSFSGNSDLCGEAVKRPCLISASPTPLPSAPTSPPAIAAIPTIYSKPEPTYPKRSKPNSAAKPSGLRSETIIGIVIGDIAGFAILAVIFMYVYRLRRKRNVESTLKKEAKAAKDRWSSSSSESKGITAWSCLRKGAVAGEKEDSSDNTSSSDEEEQSVAQKGSQNNQSEQENQEQSNDGGTLVTVDGEKELELETLLKASAYILGATGPNITYKAVLEDGTALAVRRIGESSVDRFRNFEIQVRVIAKLVHPNLVRLRGFYWGTDEKLIIYDYVPNGSLANARYRKVGSSPCHMPWGIRFKIAKGMARGLSYLHEKKHVHGNLKPSNILLGSNMEPKIGDFGLERLVSGDTSYKAGGSTRNFGSKRSSASRESFQDHTPGPIPSPSPSPSPSSVGCLSPYHAPESLRSLKPNSKWDVYAFGVILLELLTGKVVALDELGQGLGLGVEDKVRVLRMADVAIRADVEGKEEILMACFKLGYSCASHAPQKRPQMKEVVAVLDKIPCSSFSSSPYYCTQY